MNIIKKKLTLFLILILLCFTTSSHAKKKWHDYDHFYFQTGSYIHLTDNDDYDGKNLMIGLEGSKNNGEIHGLILFDNSFGQFSQYAYMGKTWNLKGKLINFHTKITVGIIHGYKEPYDNKIPLTTRNGWSPGIIPSFGYKKGNIGFDLMLLGYDAIMFSVGADF